MNYELRQILQRQHYAIIGKHSGVKLCHWMRQSLLYGRVCYKQIFYGIQSHRCLQMTPTINHCTQMCLFCWRFQSFTERELKEIDDPVYILDKAIDAQKRLISGFKGDPRCDGKKWEEANFPNMVACSLSGEPTLYPNLGEFFEECHKRKITTFLVTNGTNPKILETLTPLPKQLYVSIVAPNKKIYEKICSPLKPDGWKNIINTLGLLPSLSTRIVIRHTLIKDLNMSESFLDEYATLDSFASPLFVEPKGYVFVGDSRKRMRLSNMPSHEQILTFGKKLAERLGYKLLMERPDSRVVLLGKNSKTPTIIS